MLRSTLLPSALLAVMLAGPALAMDLPPPVIYGEDASSMSIGEGWYIRGDFGYNGMIKPNGNPDFNVYNPATDTTSTQGFDKARMSSDYSISGGIGYQFTDYLRTDVTADWFTGSMTGRSTWDSPCSPGFGTATTSCRYNGADFKALGMLANAYVDLGTYWGITPYVGGGAGLTNLEWGTVDQTMACTGTAADCALVSRDNSSHPGITSWRFTYALMAGASYDMTAHTKLDFGYRYSKINGGDMFGYSDYEQALGAFGTKGHDKGIGRHEFRAGLRLTTW